MNNRLHETDTNEALQTHSKDLRPVLVVIASTPCSGSLITALARQVRIRIKHRVHYAKLHRDPIDDPA